MKAFNALVFFGLLAAFLASDSHAGVIDRFIEVDDALIHQIMDEITQSNLVDDAELQTLNRVIPEDAAEAEGDGTAAVASELASMDPKVAQRCHWWWWMMAAQG